MIFYNHEDNEGRAADGQYYLAEQSIFKSFMFFKEKIDAICIYFTFKHTRMRLEKLTLSGLKVEWLVFFATA